MTISRDIRLSVIAEVQQYAKQMAKIPGITEKQAGIAARKMAAELTKAQAQAARAALKAANQGGAAWKDVFTGVLAADIAREAGRAFLGVAKDVQEYRSEILIASQATGLATETMAGIELAAERSGVGFDQLMSGLENLPERMVQAAAGSGEVSEALGDLGVSVNDANGNLKDADTFLREVLDRLASVDNEAERSGIAMSLFGDAAALLNDTLGDSESLDRFVSFAREYGVDVGPKALAATQDWDAAQAELQMVTRDLVSDLMDQVGGAKGLEAATLGLVHVINLAKSGYEKLRLELDYLGSTNIAEQAAILKRIEAFGSITDHAEELTREYYEQRAALVALVTADEDAADSAGRVAGRTREKAEAAKAAAAAEREAAKAAREAAQAYKGQLDALGAIGDIGAEASSDLLSGEQKLMAARDAQLVQIAQLEREAVALATTEQEQVAIREAADLARIDVIEGAERELQAARIARADAIAAKEAENAAAELARQARLRDAYLANAQIVAGAVVGSLGAWSNALAGVEKAFGSTKDAAIALFWAAQAAAIAQIGIDTAKTAIALAPPPPVGLGPIAGPIVAGIIGAGALAGVLATKPPSFAVGGEVPYTAPRGSDPNARLIEAHVGEVVLNRQDLAAITGAMGATRLVPVPMFRHRVFDAAIADALRRHSPLSGAVSYRGAGQRRFRSGA